MGKNVGFPRLTRLKFVIHTPKTIPPFSGRLDLEAKILIHKLINFTHPYPVALGVNKSPGFYFHTRKRRFLRRKERVCKSQGGGCRKPSLVADPGVGPGGPPPLTFIPNWGPKGRKHFFGDCPPPPYLRVWMTGPPLSEVWIRHFSFAQILNTTQQEPQHCSKSMHPIYFHTVKYHFKGQTTKELLLHVGKSQS